MTRVDVNPALYAWAIGRARSSSLALATRFPRLAEWESGRSTPTLKQLEAFAAATHAPIGFFFLPAPPVEVVPIPDFRTIRGAPVTDPSANLLDTIYVCEQRQEWYRDFARGEGADPLAFVGSTPVGADVVDTGATIRETIGFDLAARANAATWQDALRQFVGQAENTGILVMISGVVLNNTHRKLETDEFRGFAIADPLAPVVFVNGSDTKSGQMFTLGHELAHIWAGQSALSNPQARDLDDGTVEKWCNAVAAELLVPLVAMRAAFDRHADLHAEVQRLARHFKVSTLVILRRAHDIGALDRGEFWSAYDTEVARLRSLGAGTTSGGNFHLTEAVRVSKRFARALVVSTLAGQTLYRDAFRMLGFSRMETFHEFGRSLGVVV